MRLTPLKTPVRLVTLLLVGLAASPATGQTPVGRQVRQIAGNVRTYVVRDDGTLISWGREAPAADPSEPETVDLPGKVRQVASGYDMDFALLEDGRLFAWGANDRGQFGQGPGSSRTPMNPLRSDRPVRVIAPDDLVQIAAGGYHGLAIRKDGTVLQWGERPSAGSGSNETAMTPLAGLTGIVEVAAAGDHDLALSSEGLVFAWGENKNGQLGVPLATRRSPTPVQVVGLDHIVHIGAAGTTNFGFSAAIKADGSVWMWGSDQSATMGDGVFWGNNGPSPEDHDTPVVVKGVTGAKSLAIGTGHVLVLLNDGTLRTWGHDGWGQAGVGTAGFYQPLPKKPVFAGVASIYAVGNTSFAVKTDDTVWWWGVALVNRMSAPLGRNRNVPTLITLP